MVGGRVELHAAHTDKLKVKLIKIIEQGNLIWPEPCCREDNALQAVLATRQTSPCLSV